MDNSDGRETFLWNFCWFDVFIGGHRNDGMVEKLKKISKLKTKEIYTAVFLKVFGNSHHLVSLILYKCHIINY